LKAKTALNKKIVSIILMLTLLISNLYMPIASVLANGGYEYKGGAGEKVSDLDTSTKYSESLGDNASTEYSGRIWTDKSVYTDDVTFATFGGGSSTIELNGGDSIGEDFLVAYSALATSQSVSGQTQAPVDVVLIIDISGSMSNSDSNMDNGKSRIYNTVQATNDAIDKLMALNPYTRVAVVAFSSSGQVLLPLDRYTKGTEIQREWVQTGDRRWEGYWKETEVEVPYFSVDPETADDDNATLTTNAVNPLGETISKTTSVSGGTNIQVGLYEGMKLLAEEKNTTAEIDGKQVTRVPSVIMLSDGSPTYSSDSTSWWAPERNNNDGPGSAPYAGNGMKAILVGSYMKNAIDRNYKVAGTAYSTTVYTVGMGITGLDDDEKDLANMTLNPGEYWNDNSVTNSMKTTIKNYWDSYTSNNNTGTLNINVGKYQNRVYSDKNYALNHPNTGYDVDPVDGYNYVDDYYDADNASAVTNVFNQIVTNISIAAPQIPTEIKGTDPISDGYITYTDPIGKYMEVKDVKAIIYAGTTFTNKNTVVEGNKTTYVFSGTVESAVYGNQDIKNILITVDTAADGSQTLVIKIPASVIPLRVNEVVLNADGSVKTHTNNGAYPARVVYSVGLQSEITKESDDGEVYIDKSKISAEYLEANTNDDGTINFYSNIYTNTNKVNGSFAGDATVEFEPSHSNGFYYILEDMPIYKDAEFKQQVTASEGINDNTVYYYRDEYYHGSSVEVDAIERTGAQLKLTAIKTGEDGNLYRAAGSPRLNRILKFEGTKTKNATKTAEDFYAPTFEYAEGSTDAYEGKFVIYHGNNGVLSLVAGGNLEITKTVNSAPGVTAPDKSFEFTLDLDGNDVNKGTYDYVIVDAAGETVSTGTVSASNTKINLKNGQTATIYSLPPSTTYKITETDADGFIAESEGATGTIRANKTSVAKFTNTYNVDPVSFPTNGSLVGQKELAGREWTANDSFTFFITPYNNAPLPANYDANTGITVNKPDTEDGQTASFDFGTIEFTAPGLYRYTIVEKEPENEEYLPGMSYSKALYRLVVNVEDNGDGTLKIASYDIQRLYDDDANALFTYDSNNEIVMNNGQEAQDAIKFTNTYSAEAVTRVPVAIKDYTDNSGQNPLVSGMFEFKLEAVGIVEGNAVIANSASKVPMPAGSVNGAITTTNEGHNITFPSVTFTQQDIPENSSSVTYRYQMSEITPANKVNGMTYDNSKYIIDVFVSIDANSHTLNVSAIYPNDERIVTFRNQYTPVPVKADIDGSKTLNGRDMRDGEEFEFVLGANAATSLAIRNGEIAVPKNTATVIGAKDGVASEFSFEDIEFKKPGTYGFTVSETKGNLAAVKYDDSIITVTVVIDDANKDGNLEVTSITYSNGKNSADFINTYTSEFSSTPISLSGTKNLIGKTLLAGEFYFNVAEYYNGDFVSEGLVSHTEDKTDDNGTYTGSINFLDGVTYDKAGEYTYYITEQIPDPKVGGTTYDQSNFRYTVIVVDDLDGNLVVTSKTLQKLNGNAWENANEIVFNNKYVPTPTKAELPLIKKVVSGDRSKALEAGEFQFVLSKVSANPADGMTLPNTTIVPNAANGDVVFDQITFTKAGTYSVSIKEIIPEDSKKLAGITYSTQEIIATYSVVDNRNGELTAVLTNYVGGDTIVNEYTAEPAEVTIDIKKNFTGRTNDEWLVTDKFDFEIVVLDPDTIEAIENGEIEFPLDNTNSEIAQKSIDSNSSDKTVSGKVKINRSGTYKFIVREITGDISGVHYDSQPREITIEATDDSTNAKINTVVKINGQQTDNLTLTFNNVYDATSTELSGHDHLTVEKLFTGRESDAWLDTDEFVFTLEAYDDVTKEAVANNLVEMPANCELTVSNANKAHPHFGNIIFHKTGTYKFKVTELDNGIKGVTYDLDKDRIIVVEVTDNNDGALVAKIADDSEKLTFTNTYSAKEGSLVGETSLKIIKSLVGRNWLADDKFTFTIKPFGETTQNAVEVTKDVVMSASAEIEVKAPSGGHEGDVTAYFGNITFKKAGNYRFVITENEGSNKNITYDTHSYYVYVEVTDNNEGQLVATPTYHNTNIFENSYTPDFVSAEIKGEKDLDGNRTLADGDFEFTISAVTNGAPMPANTKVNNTADGKIDFGKIEFSNAGTYVYEIKETKGNILGVTYDLNKVTATVTVSYDKATGKLSANTVYVKEGEQGSKTSFTFKNTYKAEASEPISLTAKKNVTPSDGNSYTLKGGEFSFIIEGTQGAPMPANTTAKNDATGNVNFGTVKFTEDGTYKYTVREVQEKLGGFTYDGAVYTITVEVTDVIAEAKLKTSVKITDANNKDASVIFDNKYNPKETSAIIFGSKALESEHKEIEADEFEFSIKSVTQDAPMPSETTVKNAATGIFQFGSITYTKVGTYKYEITENDLGKKGYTYDDAVYTVTVTVTDENGQLVANVDGVGTAQEPAIKFLNKYVPDSIDVVLGADGELTKELEGREMNKDEFIFAVLDGEDKEVATAKNSKDGTFEFTLSFTKAGTYNYTIVEKNNEVAGVTYDKNTYGVEIVITDKGGYLKADSVVYTLESEDIEKVVFNNKYKADSTDITISAVKKLTGRDINDGEFKFVLKDNDSKVIATATNTKDGKIVFDKIVITEAGIYKYTVLEKSGTLENITYDKTEYVVEIEVVDEGKGKLVASTPVIKKVGSDDAVAEIIFQNTYTVPTPPDVPESPETGDNTSLGLWFALMFISCGAILTTLYGKKKTNEE